MSEKSSDRSQSLRTELSQELEEHGVHLRDGNKVCWNQNAKDYPRNWSPWTKCWTSCLIFWLELYMTLLSSAGTAAADSARMEYGISRTLAYFAFVTLYLIGQTLGGIFCSPISEVWGRRELYAGSSIIFCVFSAVVAAVPSVIAVCFGRFLQGVAAAIPATVAFGNMVDMFDARERVWVVFGYTFSGFIGIALGPIYSAYITHVLGWRWVFYISTIVMAVTSALTFTIRESKASQLLRVKVNKIHNLRGRADIHVDGDEKGHRFSIRGFVRNSLFRPLVYLFTEPIVTFCAALCATAFGLLYGLTAGLTVAYTNPPFDRYFSETSSSLSFLAILIGIILDVLPRFYDDWLYQRCRRNKQRIVPETKIRGFAIACPVMALGLWIFAWTVPPRVTTVPWPVSMIGLVCIGFASTDFSYTLFSYCSDSYGEHAASAVSALSTVRTTTAAVFPLFAHQMFSGLGTNIAVTILASVATLFSLTPFLFLKYGKTLRHKSKAAQDDQDCLIEENSHLDE